ncbi:MAG: ring-cleaving dioxygenase [Balneolaceae bacterium]|nr:ring-cleaving dioxygenase [Balneolaceae bacterium]
MKKHQKGIHHITVMAGDPRSNVQFYVDALGLRMVKKSVNQDDPGTYHLFYGNASATPGSSLTFFPWPRAVKGEPGSGEAVTVSFSAPSDSLDFWTDRLSERSIPHGDIFQRFGKTVLPFEDPDGLSLELVFEEIEFNPAQDAPWQGTVSKEHALKGFWGTTLKLTREQPTAKILENVLGFSKSDSNENSTLYTTNAPIGSKVLIETVKSESGTNGRGIIHHVAFRASDEDELDRLRQQVSEAGLSPTKIIDRHWFKSVYYQTPGGVLFEMATDGPGYAVDEDPEHLGEKLILPPWLESRRELIEKRLPKIEA